MEVKEPSARYLARPRYKQTEVGVIPDDWEVMQLKQISPSQTVGLVINPSNYVEADGVVPMLVGSNIKPNKIEWEAARRISEDSNQALPASRLFSGDLVVVRVGEPGTTAVVPQELDGCNCASVMIVRRHSGFDSQWLCYVMNSNAGLAQIAGVQYGTAQKQFNISDAINFKYATPSVFEQHTIAEALSDADALIESLNQLITKKRNLKQGAMQELLTGKKRLPGFSGAWEVKRLGDVLIRLANGAVYKSTTSRGLAMTRIETIADGAIDYSRTGNAEASSALGDYKVLHGDILFSHINSLDHIGKVAQFHGEQDLYHGMNLLLLRTNEYFNSRFLYFWLKSAAARRMTRNLARQAVSQASINTTELKSLEFFSPPKAEQTAIATILSDMDTELAGLQSRLAKARQIKQGMMQELLTGRIRLL